MKNFKKINMKEIEENPSLEIPSEFNSAFLNVTLSSNPGPDGRYSIMDLKQTSKGDWWIKPEYAEKIKYVFPVKKNKILGVLEVKGFTEVDINGKTRIRFDLKPIYEGSHTMIGKANYDVNKTNYVVKLFNL